MNFFWRNIYDSKNWTFFFTKSKNWSFFTNMIHSKNSSLLNLFIWLKELHSFLNMTPRIGLVSKWLKELNLFLKMTQKFCSLDLTQNWFFWLWLSERYCFVYFDSNNWTVFKIRPKGLNFFDWLINMIQRIVFSLMSHRIEHFFEHERIEPSSFFMTQRIEPFFFFGDSIEHFSDPKNWTFFLNTTLFWKNWTLFWNVTQRIEPDFHKIDSKNWTFFSQMTRRLELSFTNMSDRNRRNFFFLIEKKKKMTPRIDFLKISIKKLYFDDSKNWVLFFFEKHDSRNLTIFPCDSRNWTLLSNMTHSNWILFFLTWLKELNPFWNMTQRVENFSWIFDSKNWIFFEYDSKIWTFFLNVTHRIEFFMTQRIEFFQYDKDFVEYDSKNRTFFFFFFENLFKELFFSMILWIELIFQHYL